MEKRLKAVKFWKGVQIRTKGGTGAASTPRSNSALGRLFTQTIRRESESSSSSDGLADDEEEFNAEESEENPVVHFGRKEWRTTRQKINCHFGKLPPSRTLPKPPPSPISPPASERR